MVSFVCFFWVTFFVGLPSLLMVVCVGLACGGFAVALEVCCMLVVCGLGILFECWYYSVLGSFIMLYGSCC